MTFKPHTLLPLDLQRRLVAAARSEPHIAKGESFIRTVKVDNAIEVVRAQCPKRFTPDPERK